MSDYLRGFDVDNDELARSLRVLADGIESRAVPVFEASETHDVTAEDVSEVTISVTFGIPQEMGPLNAIQYETNE